MLISQRGTGDEKQKTGGRPAGADWQLLEGRLIQRRGVSEVVRSGEHVAGVVTKILGTTRMSLCGEHVIQMVARSV